MIPLACPGCGASFRSSDIDRSLALATCHACNAVLDLKTRDPITDERLDQLTRRPPSASAVPIPEKFKIDESSGRFEVRWRWFAAVHVFLAFFALFWNAVILTWLGAALLQGEPMVALFGTLHALVGLVLGYVSLSGFINSTRVWLENGTLNVRHGPLPWFGGGSWRRDELAQLYGEEVRGSRGSVNYALSAMLRDGRRVKLVQGLAEKAHVLWLERSFENRMQIADLPVTGELQK